MLWVSPKFLLFKPGQIDTSDTKSTGSKITKHTTHKSKSYFVWNETNSGQGTSHMKFWFNYFHRKHGSALLESQEFQVIRFRCTTLVHIFDYIWMLFDLQTFRKKKWIQTHLNLQKKKGDRWQQVENWTKILSWTRNDALLTAFWLVSELNNLF